MKFYAWAASALMVMAPVAATAQVSEPVNITIASFSPGSSWYVYAATMGEILRDQLPEGSVIDTPPLGGGHANAQLVAAGRADIALSHGMTNRWALEGIIAYDQPLASLRGLVGGLDSYYLNVTAAGAPDGTTITDYFAQANPDARIGLNPRGSMATFAGELILQEAGADEESLGRNGGSYNYIPIPDTTSGFADGTIDVTPQMITVGHPMTTEISELSDVVQLVPTEEVLTAMESKYGFGRNVLPAGSFRGQNEDIVLPATNTTLIADESLDEDLAYSITKAIVEGAETLAQAHGALADFDPENAWRPELLNLPLHPGAERYYRERGWLQ